MGFHVFADPWNPIIVKKICIVEGCDRNCHARGLCKKHYSRFLNGVDPHTPRRLERSPEDRLKAKLDPQDPVTGCIEWTGTRTNGYGQISRDGKTIGAHCLAYELKHGPIPKGLCVCHHCDNPACCNGAHLYLGTKGDNNADRDAKGRGGSAKGEKNGRAKLAEAAVVEIRRLAAVESQRKLASVFNISKTQVGNIKTGKSWSHLKTNQ
jgi:hypothetical protein